MTHHFCTYFDHHYLARGLTLFRSLEHRCTDFVLHVLCLDDETRATIEQIALPNLVALPLSTLERSDPALLHVKPSRSKLEYYYTCTPCLPLHLMKALNLETLTYVDADLFFFADPSSIAQAFEGYSVLLIELRHPPAWERAFNTEQFGRYNVGFLTFRNDAEGLRCLEWWRERCLEWCGETPENGRFADQKYLDEWPTMFRDVLVLKDKGANLAFWNWDNYRIRTNRGITYVDDEPLLFTHMSRLKQINRWAFVLNFDHPFTVPWVIRRACFAPYLVTLREVDAWIRQKVPSYAPTYRDLRSNDEEWTRIMRGIGHGNLMISAGPYAL